MLRQLTVADQRVVSRLEQIDDAPFVQRRAAGNGQERDRRTAGVGRARAQRAAGRRARQAHRVQVLAGTRRGQRQRAGDTAALERAGEAAGIVDRDRRLTLCPSARDARLGDRERIRRVVVQREIHDLAIGRIAAREGLVRGERTASEASRVAEAAERLEAVEQRPARRRRGDRSKEGPRHKREQAVDIGKIAGRVQESRHVGRARLCPDAFGTVAGSGRRTGLRRAQARQCLTGQGRRRCRRRCRGGRGGRRRGRSGSWRAGRLSARRTAIATASAAARGKHQ